MRHFFSLLTLLALSIQVAWADKQSLPSYAFVDEKGVKTITDIIAFSFDNNTRIQQSFGITTAVIWLKIPLPNHLITDPEQHYICLNSFSNDRVEMFAVNDEQRIIAYWIAGDQIEYHTQEESFRQPTFPMSLETQASASHLYLRVTSQNAISFAVELISNKEWQRENKWVERTHFLVMGFFAMALLIAIFNILILRLYYYNWYVVLLLSLTAVVLSITGWLPIYFSSDWFEHINLLGQLLIPMSLIYISHLLLKTKQFLPQIYRAKLLMIWSAAAIVLWCLLTHYIGLGLKIAHSLLILVPFWLLIESLWLIKKTPFAKHLAIILFLLFVIAFARIGMINGIFGASLLALHGPTISLVLISLLIYFSMSYALKNEREEKIKAEAQAQFAQTQSEQRRLFLTMMAHELNTPLAVMNATLDNLAMRLPQDERTQGRIDKLNKTITQMNEVIDDCLLNERLQHETSVKLNLTSLEEWFSESMKQLMLIQNVERIQLPEHIPNVNLHLNLPLMKIALVNLLDNALKYSPNNKQVMVSIHVSDHPDHQCCVAIQDQGLGFAQPVLANTEVVRRNLGLGLEMSHKIIVLNGGKLVCENNNLGAKVSIFLPCNVI